MQQAEEITCTLVVAWVPCILAMGIVECNQVLAYTLCKPTLTSLACLQQHGHKT